MEIQPFKVKVSDEILENLRIRLVNTRWPDKVNASEWEYGTDVGYLKELVEYWQTFFNWRTQENYINSFNQYRASISGLGIHFIHEKGIGPNPFPLIISHGWPGSIFEMLKIIPMLTDPAASGGNPEDAFDVVVPSLPGYGFSDRPQSRGYSNIRIAEMWHKLMTEGLGYSRFGSQGGDWGGMISSRLGFEFPDKVAGVHLNLLTGVPVFDGNPDPQLSPSERDFLESVRQWTATEGGYFHIQRTKPQTLSVGLNDSPAGLASWIVEKFRTWSDCGGQVEQSFTKDELLANIMIYWVTETIASSTRHYYENRIDPWRFMKNERVEVPCGVAIFPGEINQPPREWANRTHNIQRWTRMPRGGHFAAMEEPLLLATDIREFFRPLR